MQAILGDFQYDFNTWVVKRQKNSKLKIYPYSQLLFAEVFKRQNVEDSKYAIFSAVAVFIYMLIHTQSVLVSIAGFFVIVCSFPISIVIYSLVFGVSYISGFHFISVYLMFGIGADNIFLLYDAWAQSEELKELK